MRIALHSQTLLEADGKVAGSEITTLGLARAFERHPDVTSVRRVGPQESFPDADLILVEGWTPNLKEKLARTDALKIFWNLSFHGFQEIPDLPVDGFLTNSKTMVPYFDKPTRFCMLATDFQPKEGEPKLVYLGRCRTNESPTQLQMMVEASIHNLEIYGMDWQQEPLLRNHWRGPLPLNEIERLYSSSTVLCTTEDRQRAAGMINNRVFEAVACGACTISEYFPELEEVFGDHVHYVKKPGDVLRFVREAKPNPAGPEFIRKHHTWDHRVQEILEFIYSHWGKVSRA